MTNTSNSALAQRAIDVAEALQGFDHLPTVDSLGVTTGSWLRASFYGGYTDFSGVIKVSEWAHAFDVPVTIALGSSSGDALAMINLGGHVVTFTSYVGTAQAYELGRLLGQPLDEKKSITVLAADLLAAVPAQVAS